MVIAAVASTSVFADTQKVKRLKACGSEARNEFGSHTELPAVDEGNGFVGFATVDEDASGTRQRYTLVNCATRAVVQAKAEYKLADVKATLASGGDLLGYIASLRKAKQLANEALLERSLKSRGFKPVKGQLPARGSKEAVRSDCGCATYYPGL
jgi:hypothetical protein